MKCDCKECGGTGRIMCPECDGRGGVEGSIENVVLEPSMHNYKELVELQRDAKRCVRQAERLKQMNPARVGSYTEQLAGCLAVINEQAEKAATRK